ncbi:MULTISPECIES: 5-(carboxyamino)imidazole ribonucleotide mutase [Microbulbifer]|uniref:N5-carboxyaminoimidazole ribonucleotide mutase n=1 Tax=Microbulbifer celer TaxID=435905 RepID=A0ABW3U8V8_9GAMM|nr:MULTISPECIES: 5-(carboxyamino)imidazole ribonucleotide mutase [Microbulbifer]UFN56968.1 5-(carboxyamino)imidazole ribonucleotide mutase [Microbulbifer celer]
MNQLPFEKVTIVMGSQSDWPTMEMATKPLADLGVPFATAVVSAHRTPQRMTEFATTAHERGTQVIIAGAGGSAHLPGMIAAMTPLPVIGVPVASKFMTGMDSLLSIVQMPKGVAVATQAVGASGAFNAGLMAAQMLSLSDPELQKRLIAWRENQSAGVPFEVE